MDVGLASRRPRRRRRRRHPGPARPGLRDHPLVRRRHRGHRRRLPHLDLLLPQTRAGKCTVVGSAGVDSDLL